MAKKRKPGRPSTGNTRSIFARIPPDVGDLLDAFLASLKPIQPTTTSVVIAALLDYLAAKGFRLPDKEPEDE